MAQELVAAVKPRLRGWIHLGMAPVALAGAIVLVALAPTTAGKWSSAVFGAASILLFGISAVYHRGNWSPTTTAVLRRLDHTNIFLVIAGSCTPMAVILLDGAARRTTLLVIWGGALAGLLARVFWLGAPRWFYTPVYVALGWVAVWQMPAFWNATPQGPTIVWLIAAGGLAYTIGAVVYGTRRPNPSPRWFGFHEVFHSLTVIGFTCHYIAASIAVYHAG
ncbi:MAG TPA: hemolysin III family protein [Polyangiaceae bacterium]|nr:hemolysin III family protein [Polyangiaceae bacterium]